MIIRRAMRICWWTAAGVIVSLAVLLSAARLLLPGMSDYREQIETLAESVFDSPVDIGSLDAAWHGLSPVLQLNDVRVQDSRLPGGELAIAEVQVALAVFKSLFQGKWRTAGIKLIGIEFELHSDLRNPRQPINLQLVIDWLLLQESISLEQVQLRWRDPGLFDAPVRLSDLSAQLVNQGNRHQLVLESRLPMALGQSIKIAADLRGRGADNATWDGTLYLKTDDLQLAGFYPAIADAAVAAKGALNLELWMGVTESRPVWGSGSLLWQKPELRNTSADAQGIAADNLEARFHWRENESGWRVGVEDLELVRDRQAVWPQSQFDVEIFTGQGLTVQGEASLLVLDEVNSILPLIPWVDDDALIMIDRLQPRGLMRDAEFEGYFKADDEPRFALRSAVEDLSLAANGGLPGAKGLSGFVEGNLQAGSLRVATEQAELIMPRLFPGQDLPLSSINGVIEWQRYKQAFRFESEHLQIESGPLAIDSRWRLDWAYEQAAPWLDLQLAVDSLPMTGVQDYLPSGVMSPKAVTWLRNAFEEGTASDMQVLLQGRLDQMPFDAGEGRFEARFDFEDVVLDYHPTWGQLDELAGYAVFSGRSMQIVGRSARLMDSQVERVVAEIDDLQKPLLRIDGTVGGTLAGMLEFVRVSPLKKKFGALVGQLDASGDAQLQLDLSIPLKKNLGRIKVNGDLLFDANDLQPKQSQVGLSHIQGRLRFDREGISVKNAKARLLQQPVGVNVYRQGPEGKSATVVDVRGNLKLVDLLNKKNSPLAQYLEGSAYWKVLLEIGNQAQVKTPRVMLKLASDLEGVKVNLPAPFAKLAEEKRPLSIKWAPGKEADYALRAEYHESAEALVLLKDGAKGVRKAGLNFGPGSAKLPEKNEFRISGKLDVFDLNRWLPVFRAGGKRGGRMPPPAIALQADEFRFAGFKAAGVTATTQSADPWYFQVDGEDGKGWVRWVGATAVAPSRLLLKLDHLKVEKLPARTGSDTAAAALKATDLPELDIHVDALSWGKRNLGAVTVVSNRVLDGTRFKTLSMIAPAIEFDGNGAWLQQAGGEVSRFDARVNNGSLEKLTALLDTGSSVDGGDLTGEVQMSWPGSPVDFALATLEGDIKLKATDGRLTSVDEGPGKLLSLFSLNSLQRRLNLDFRDVVKEGFSFDKMEGHFVVMDGDAFTNDFTIAGTSVRIDISGRTGLTARDYDQLVTVTPQVTSTLPIAGAIAGGPAVGAAVFLADKLVGDQFNRLTQVQYQVTGSWEEPVYKRLKKERQKTPEDPHADDS